MYESPDCEKLYFAAESSFLTGSDLAGENMEEGEYWYEY